MEGDRSGLADSLCKFVFQSTPSAWRETQNGGQCKWVFAISIHSLRMEGDNCDIFTPPLFIISIHSLRMEGDADCVIIESQSRTFQSTPSAWRETNGQLLLVDLIEFQSTPSAWRETRLVYPYHGKITYFNPLPPHGGRPKKGGTVIGWIDNFNPLPPHGGRHSTLGTRHDFTEISIHSLRMEGDRSCESGHLPEIKFQSTPSAWRETNEKSYPKINTLISIHSLRMEGDFAVFTTAIFYAHFNPLPPHGGRPVNDM